MEICSTHRAEEKFDYKKNLSKYDHVTVHDDYRKYPLEIDLREYIIPSMDVKMYHSVIGYYYSDFAIAAMITWSEMPFFRKIDELKKIKEECKDEDLIKQLDEYICYMEYSYKSFLFNDNREYFYILNILWDEDKGFEENGYFINFDDAVDFSKRAGNVEKKIVKVCPVTSKEDYADYEDDYIFSEVGCVYFDKNGVWTYCDSYEVPEPPMSDGAFHSSYINIPYPFRTGDVVRIITENNRLGLVFGYKTQEEIDEAYERLKDSMDYSDYQVSVDKYYYDEKDDSFGWGHEHISPLKMEYANLKWNEIESGSEEYLMMIASDVTKGKASISSLEYFEEKYREAVRKKRLIKNTFDGDKNAQS